MTTREAILILAIAVIIPMLFVSIGCNVLLQTTIARMETEMIEEKQARLKTLREAIDTARRYEAYRKRMGER